VQARPDLETFVPGELYRHSDTDEIVEFIGVATVPEILGEAVGVFRWATREGGCLIATQRSYLAGETFQPFGEAIDDDAAESGV
jgi:hypothetical protein